MEEEAIRRLADSYLPSERVIIAWCLGLTQHEHGVDTIREIVNVLMLRGNLGREGAGPCPVRGHSNVQGNRTCGVDNRPGAAFLDRLAEVCGIDPPREPGLGTVGAIEAMRRGEVKVFVALGGNFAPATPDQAYTFEALRTGPSATRSRRGAPQATCRSSTCCAGSPTSVRRAPHPSRNTWSWR
ncbi:hypothetical protein GCM10009733_101570 [Nonomuraea maheshkhaliensis]|uniref:Molybdopterin oxidoreductase domain-containing protein n=1 Tax=Nonomuraea maheshkhaliensis TaxID=419590 RepID=A0ABP4TIS0_9ACTN